MAEPDDPRRPPGGYLPRIAKFTPPEGEDEDEHPGTVEDLYFTSFVVQ